jgi:hypothetical protein
MVESKHKTQQWMLLLLAAVMVGCCWQLARVFLLRFESGDVYPVYSSYRSDPMGARVFYESLAALDNLEVSRHHEPLEDTDLSPETVLVLTGVYDSRDPAALIEHLEDFMARGGRMVFSFHPRPDIARKRLDLNSTPSNREDSEGEPEGEDKDTRRKPRMVDIKERWGFDLTQPDDDRDEHHEGDEADEDLIKRITAVHKVSSDDTLPARIEWRSTWFFEGLDTAWEVLYEGQESEKSYPAVIERSWGEGSLMIVADSYFLSNEGLRDDPNAAFLARLIGPHPRILVDETHHGVQRSQSVMLLMRKYGLDLFLLSFVLLALLHVWRQGYSLVPRRNMQDSRALLEAEQGKDAFSGLTHVVQRSVSEKELVKTCYEAWRRDFGHDPRYHRVTSADVSRALAQESTPEQYQSLQRMVEHARTGTKGRYKP